MAAVPATPFGVPQRGFPVIRNGLRELLGQDAADLFFGLTQMVTLTLSDNPLGLAVTGSEALILLREVVARRAAWRRYEQRLARTADAEPGAQIRLESGERTPRAARVIEGTGTALGRDGLPRPLAPGATASAGARLLGGPFVLQLQGGSSFTPGHRPAPPAPSLYRRYIRAAGPASLAYAVLTGVSSTTASPP